MIFERLLSIHLSTFIKFYSMQTSRKSFKAFSVAQPLKKEIDDTLMKVQLQKRKFLTLQREQSYLKETLQRKRKDLNDLKSKQPQTRTFTSRAWQTNNIILNVDKTSLSTFDSIQQLKNVINVHRKQITKYKEMNARLKTDIDGLTKKNQGTNGLNLELEDRNEELKVEILQYRERNLRNTAEFTKSHNNINKSDANEVNQRKKFSINQRSFLGQEFKNSKLIPFDNLSDQLRTSGIRFSQHTNEIMTASVPLAKERIKIEIRKNKEKLRISENYKKFGENLENMFQIMKEYKGRDDLDFIAQQFVTKEKQLQKIEEYIGQLQSRIQHSQTMLRLRKNQDEQLKQEITRRVEKEDEKFIILQQKVKEEIKQLKDEEANFFAWFQKIGSILMPLIQEPLTRNNAANQIGAIQQELSAPKEDIEKRPQGKVQGLPAIELPERQIYSQMMSYQKLRDFAAEYVKTKKA